MTTLKHLNLHLSTDDKLLIQRVLLGCPNCQYNHNNGGDWIYDVDAPIIIKHLRSACFARGYALRHRVERAYGQSIIEHGFCADPQS